MSARPEPPASPVRGAILVVVAVVLGIILIRNGIDTDVSAEGGEDSPQTSATSEGGGTTSSTAPLRPPAQVKVVVANASGVDGAARTVTTTLQGMGYATGSGTNAPANVTATVVYYVAGFEREAQAVATAIGGQPTIVQPMPTPPPIADTQGANVVVVLGPDLAPQ